MAGRREVVLGALLWLAGCGMPARGDRADGAARAALNDALRAGGHVLFIRHAATDRIDGGHATDRAEWPRDRQRNLSRLGIAQARRIGDRVRNLGIPVGEVRASPFFRCMETAELAFGRVDADPRLIDPRQSGGPPGRLGHIRREIARLPAPGTNTVLVGHVGTMTMTGTVGVQEGETVVFRPDGAGGSAMVARLAAEAW